MVRGHCYVFIGYIFREIQFLQEAFAQYDISAVSENSEDI